MENARLSLILGLKFFAVKEESTLVILGLERNMNSGLDRIMNSESAPRKSRLNWKDHETRVFLKSWKDHIYINRLIRKGCSKHPLYYAISKDLQKCGYSRSMNEIYFKMKNMGKRFRKANITMPTNGGVIDFKYYHEIQEILKLETEIGTKDHPGPAQIVEASEQQVILDESYIEGLTSENVQVIRLSVPEQQDAIDSDPNAPQSYTVINVAEPEVSNKTEIVQIPLPVSSSSNSKSLQENILSSFYHEFERSNRQLERNDAAMLELFREQNDIFRTQTTLLMKLLLK